MTHVPTSSRIERTAHVVMCTVPTSGLVAANSELLQRVSGEVAPGQSVVLDLCGTDRVDSVGLAALLALIAGVRRERGEVALAARGGLARRLRFVGLERIAPVCESTEDAVAAVQRSVSSGS